MFKNGDVFVLTNVPGYPNWENKRMKYIKDNSYHILLDNFTDGYLTYLIGSKLFFNDYHLKLYKAKLVSERKSHLPSWW